MFDLARFALRLLCGTSLMWCLLPRAKVSSGFFRIQMLVALGLSVLGALAVSRAEAAGAGRAWDAVISAGMARAGLIVLAGASFLGSVLWTLERRAAGTFLVFAIACLSTVTLLLAMPSPVPIGGSVPAAYASELSAAALLGSALAGMLLGHWHLTAPTMSLAPLERLAAVFGGTAVVRAVVAAACLWMAYHAIETSTHAVWLGLRWIAGIGAPLVLAVMVRRILRYRNTQAATGVLFVAVILTFIGEMTALLLERDLGRPL
ncbi:MAG TPA: hypothetical protein VML55_09690 [Planctomycetaceae bacterium]|nr:hypothetical protein [Planctomycetaceae bacterium]